MRAYQLPLLRWSQQIWRRAERSSLTVFPSRRQSLGKTFWRLSRPHSWWWCLSCRKKSENKRSSRLEEKQHSCRDMQRSSFLPEPLPLYSHARDAWVYVVYFECILQQQSSIKEKETVRSFSIQSLTALVPRFFRWKKLVPHSIIPAYQH